MVERKGKALQFSDIYGKLRSERIQRLSKEGFWIVLGQAMAVVGSLVGVRVLTGLLNPSAYGELALGMTVATLVNQVILGPLGNGITRFYAPSVEKNDLTGYLKATGRLLFWATGLIILLIPFAAIGLLLTGQAKWIAIVTTAFIFALVSGYNGIFSGIQNAARQRSIVAFHQGIQPWLQYLIAASLLVWLGATSTNAMMGYAVAILLVNGSLYYFFRSNFSKHATRAKDEKNWREKILNYSWPFAAWGVFTWLQLSSDRWALGYFATTKVVGMYAVLFQLGYYPISIATSIVSQLLAPIYFQRAGDATDSYRNTHVSIINWRLTKFVLGLTIVAFIVTFIFHAQIFGLLVADEYRSVSYLLPWLTFSAGLFAAGQINALNLMSQMKTNKMVIAKVVTALLGVLLNFIGAYAYGINGIVAASFIFSIMYFLWMVFFNLTDSVG